MKKYFLIIICFTIFLSSCMSSRTAYLYDWSDYTNTTYTYIKSGNEEDIDSILEIYQKIIDGQSDTIRQTVPPGVCADYGFLLIRAGQIEEGKELLLREKELYPESEMFVDSILAKLER